MFKQSKTKLLAWLIFALGPVATYLLQTPIPLIACFVAGVVLTFIVYRRKGGGQKDTIINTASTAVGAAFVYGLILTIVGALFAFSAFGR